MENLKTAKLFAPECPSEEQIARFEAFLTKKYGKEIGLVWVEDKSIDSGFRLVFDNDVYNWTTEGRLQ